MLACASGARPAPASLDPARIGFKVDSARSEVLAPGVTHRFIYASEGPWAIQMLDIAPSSCIEYRAVKAHYTAAGREPATLLLEHLDEHERVIAGVNADFFSLATGVPQTAHIENGRLIAGASARPVLAFDATGTPSIGVLQARGNITAGGAAVALTDWNRVADAGVSVIDRNWGAATDSGSGRIEIILEGGPALRVKDIDTLPAGVAIPPSGVVIVIGKNAPAATRASFRALHIGDTVHVEHTLVPINPQQAVGGWPIILRDGVILGAVDSAGSTFAPVRHPRTAVGLFPDGHLLLIVVDGRQKPWSDGMTLRELARMFQSLGARDAINLDGGGSSTFVIRDAEGVMRIQNRPSDKVERPVANVLAVVNRCVTP